MRANRTDATTSATPRQDTISAGRLSIMPFQTRRAWSYRVSSGEMSSLTDVRSSSTAAASKPLPVPSSRPAVASMEHPSLVNPCHETRISS